MPARQSHAPDDASALLAWYDRHRRDLPWRAKPWQMADPYHVWLSEIMLQQTTVAATIPYFHRFLARFPTIQDLAAAPSDAVMQAWAGLGYYARARNLHACAIVLAGQGGFPRDVAGLQALPGIGPYTARAIAAIAFGQPVVPVDGNVERVIARRFAIMTALPAAKPEIEARLAGIGASPAARARPSDFAQSLFDLGAGPCGRNPSCMICPWSAACLARQQGIAADLPRKAQKKPRPLRLGAAFHLTDPSGRVLLQRRPASGLLGGMLQLPTTAWLQEALPRAAALAQSPDPAASWHFCGQVRHVFTHFELHLDVFTAGLRGDPPPGLWHDRAMLQDAALPSLMRKCLQMAQGVPPKLAQSETATIKPEAA